MILKHKAYPAMAIHQTSLGARPDSRAMDGGTTADIEDYVRVDPARAYKTALAGLGICCWEIGSVFRS